MDMCQTKKCLPAARVNVPLGPHMEMVLLICTLCSFDFKL